MKISLLLLILCIVVLTGCSIPSIHKYSESWVGHPIEEKKKGIAGSGSYAARIDWQEKTYQLENGNWVYIEADSKNCFIHWEINPDGIIIGYKFEGNCH